jgi:tRNA(His) 5'-end guanylyltransferase
MSKVKKDSLGDRMKTYEAVPKNYLTRRTPVIIRLDGCHAHSFTRGLRKPFDDVFIPSMQETMKYLCENIQGCVLGYTQSDEITLVLCDYKKLDTAAWFDNQVQKIVSVSASMATFAFNKWFEFYVNGIVSADISDIDDELTDEERTDFDKYKSVLVKRTDQGLTFDSRCFNVPKEEVCNCLIWRQQDATRNSIEGLAQSMFSQKELQGVNCKALQDKMFTERDVNWNDLPTRLKRGSCCVKNNNGKWFIDTEIPVFTQDREYIENKILFSGDED